MRRNIAIGASLVAVIVAGVVATVITRREDPAGTTAAVADGPFERPNPWGEMRDPAAGVVNASLPGMGVGGIEVAAPQPIGAKVTWHHEERDTRQLLVGEGTVLGAPATFEWSAGHGNPHTVFSGSTTLPTAALAEPIVSVVTLPDGELTYVDSSLVRVPFAGEPITVSALTSGTIVWKNGRDMLTFWQWNADRVTLAASDDGGFVVRFHWWDPAQHELPEQCEEQLAEMSWQVSPRLTVSFGAAPDLAVGRLPAGVVSAVVPIFIDPVDAEDPRVRDGASPNAADYAGRVRTIAMGHSSPSDARHGNGGLVGLGVGGTIVIPAKYAKEHTAFSDITATLEQTTIEFVAEGELRPDDCESWKTKLGDAQRALLGTSTSFDGKFPNLVGPNQRVLAPGFGDLATIWRATRLTGRRKEVVTQALSSTYLTRLGDKRGLAVLEIPIVASRNPLVPASSEGLLDPERGGNWTLQESLARSLAEVELLAEGEHFDLLGLQELTSFTRAARLVVFDERGDGTWLVHNNGETAVTGFTLVVNGLVSAFVDDDKIEQTNREIGNGTEQTWLWWDLSPGATYQLRLERPDAPRSRSVRWQLPQ